MRKCKWLLVSGCKCGNPFSTAVQFVNVYQDGTNASVCLGIVLKNIDILSGIN
jgi:hypothetical protein